MTQWESLSWAISTVRLLFLYGGNNRAVNGAVLSLNLQDDLMEYDTSRVSVMLLLLISADTPSMEAISSVKQLLQFGVAQDFLRRDFVLVGHRDLGRTECPGDKLYAALSQLRATK